MTKAKFWVSGGVVGFSIEGHSTENAQDDEGRIVCSAVSSAAYMAANTITDIIGDGAAADVRDGYMRFEVENPSDSTRAVLEGLKLHLIELSKQYGKRLIITEV